MMADLWMRIKATYNITDWCDVLISVVDQNDANNWPKFTLQYEYFVSIGCLRLMITNSLCTPPVLKQPTRS